MINMNDFFHIIIIYFSFSGNKYSFNIKNIQYLSRQTKITLDEVRKCGKLEEASTAYHREPHDPMETVILNTCG